MSLPIGLQGYVFALTLQVNVMCTSSAGWMDFLMHSGSLRMFGKGTAKPKTTQINKNNHHYVYVRASPETANTSGPQRKLQSGDNWTCFVNAKLCNLDLCLLACCFTRVLHRNWSRKPGGPTHNGVFTELGQFPADKLIGGNGPESQ